ncbi:hypothetical protein ILUMI_11105, partial [Ignelater luminosus]
PTYHEVLQEERNAERRLWCLRISRVSFLIADILISILGVGGLFLLFYTDTFIAYHLDIKRYCNDPHFNVTPIPEASYLHMYLSMLSMISVCTTLSIFKSKIENGKLNTVLKNGLWEMWIMGMNMVFLYALVEFLKCAAGVPRPYFFSNNTLKAYYCDDNQDKSLISIVYEQIDDDYRKSFPSCRAAFCVFSVTFLYFYLGHCDIRVGLHSTQHLLLLLMGPSTYYFLSRSWERGENHLSDILVGAAIGMCQAVVAIRSIHGKVLSTPPAVSERRTRPMNYHPTAPQDELVEDITQMIQNNADAVMSNCQINMRCYESAQTIRTTTADEDTIVYTVIDMSEDKSEDEEENGEVRINLGETHVDGSNRLIATTTV